jgi:hypothetical protein
MGSGIIVIKTSEGSHKIPTFFRYFGLITLLTCGDNVSIALLKCKEIYD